MTKNIVLIKPTMDNDELSKLLSKNVAAVMFAIKHQNYSAGARMISRVKSISEKIKRPISTIQDISDMEDPLDLDFGIRSGVDWIVTDKLAHLKLIKDSSKLVGIIYKGQDLPKDVQVDSIMGNSFVDPDAVVRGKSDIQIKHLIIPHTRQTLLDSLIDIALHSNLSAVMVADLEQAKGLRWRRSKLKIIYAPKESNQITKAALYSGIEPMFRGSDTVANSKAYGIIKKNEKVLDATDINHVAFR